MSLGVMGVYLALRRVIFLGLVVANAATVGAAAAQAAGWTPEIASLVGAVGAAIALGTVETRRVPTESLRGWAYAASASVTVLILSWAATGSTDTLLLLFGNVLAVRVSDVIWLILIAFAIGLLQLLFSRRFLLVTFDAETATVAGVHTRLWSLALNLAIGVAAAAAVPTIGALSTFALLALPSMAALAAPTSIRATFLTAAGLSIVLPSLALVLAFYLDLPAGPASVALLAISVPVAAAIGAAATRGHSSRRTRTWPKNARWRMWTSCVRSVVLASAFVGMASIAFAQPQPAEALAIRAELDRLRQEIESLRHQYSDRLSALERRLAALEGSGSQTETSQPPQADLSTPRQAAPVPQGAVGAGGPEGSLPIYGNVNVLSKIFNPDVAVIGNFLGTAGKSPGASSPAFDMREIETSLQAIVDPYARADFFFALSAEGIDVEEGYITFPTLPGGLLMKAGKLRVGLERLTRCTVMACPGATVPSSRRACSAATRGSPTPACPSRGCCPIPGSSWRPPARYTRGESALFRAHQRQDLTYVGHVRGYQDITESSNVDLGASVAYGHNDAHATATTRIFGIDGTFRFRPLRRAIYRRLQARTELVWSRRSELGRLNAFGGYLAADYQFARRWFAGARYDHTARATDRDATDKGTSWLLTYWPSEFSQIRSQYRRTNYAEGQTSSEVLFQFLIEEMRRQNVRILLVEPYFDLKTPKAIGRETGARVLVMPPLGWGREGSARLFRAVRV